MQVLLFFLNAITLALWVGWVVGLGLPVGFTVEDAGGLLWERDGEMDLTRVLGWRVDDRLAGLTDEDLWILLDAIDGEGETIIDGETVFDFELFIDGDMDEAAEGDGDTMGDIDAGIDAGTISDISVILWDSAIYTAHKAHNRTRKCTEAIPFDFVVYQLHTKESFG